MNVSFAHVCDYATVSREGKLSVLGIFDRIGTTVLPTVHPLLQLAFQLEYSRAEIGRTSKLEIRLAGEDGAEIMKAEGEIVLHQVPMELAPPGRPLHIPQVIALAGTVFPRAGIYGFDIFINGDHKKNVSFEVTLVTPASGQA